MRTILKRAIGATSVCALAVGMVFGANAFTKNDGGKVKEEKKATTTVIFKYTPPPGATNPYSQTNVQNTANWKESKFSCESPGTAVPCTITVPMSKTEGGNGTAIDDTQVTIVSAPTSPATPNQHKVLASPSSEYTDPVNRPLP